MGLLVDAAYGGSLGYMYRLRVNVDVIQTDVANNRTLVRYSAWMEKVVSGGSASYISSSGHTNINGYNPYRSMGGFTFGSGTGQRYYLAVNEDYWIGHDANGDACPYFGADHDGNIGPIQYASGGANMWMPHINRYANINSFYVHGVGSRQFSIHVDASLYCNSIQYSLDGAGWVEVGGEFWGRDLTFSGLSSGTAHRVSIRIRARDSGLWTTSGEIYATTNTQIATLSCLNITDTSLDLRSIMDDTCDMLQASIDGGSYATYFTGDFTDKTIHLGGELSSGVAHTVKIKTRAKVSQKYAESSTATFNTLRQDQFMSFFDDRFMKG